MTRSKDDRPVTITGAEADDATVDRAPSRPLRKPFRKPLRRRIPADLETPVSAFLKLQPRGAAFLLESVEQGVQVGRYSFIGIGSAATMRLRDDRVTIRRNGDCEEVAVDRADPLAPVRAELERGGVADEADLPGPFAGAVGYVSYELTRYFEQVPAPAAGVLDLPDYHFIFPETLAVFDHVKSEIELLTLPEAGPPDGADGTEAAAEAAEAVARARLDELLAALTGPLPPAPGTLDDVESSPPVPDLSEDEFCAMVSQAREHILAGDAFQIVLSQHLAGKTTATPFQIYRALRILNPSPYLFYLDLGDCQLVGSSPEMLVRVQGRRATLCPIAGTRPRGETAEADRALAEELLADEKERAEHLMLVDLGRNDLGRVCEIGSVAPESFMQIERYSHVMHLVSRVTGVLKPDLDAFDLLRAAFPAGTVTGAPKIRAMEIIADLEPTRRGPYAGAVGYFGRQGDMDLAITIRTLVMRGQEFHLQAGAGIVADSDPAREYQETLDKLSALGRAVVIAEEGL